VAIPKSKIRGFDIFGLGNKNGYGRNFIVPCKGKVRSLNLGSI